MPKDGRADAKKLIIAFRSFANVSKITQVEVDGRNEHVPLLLERIFAK
jgi:hypothetical protein